jgi:hypothetical protein
MKPDEINIAIAEFCGWRRVLNREKTKALLVSTKNKFDFCDQDLTNYQVGGAANGETIPNYYGDLNACRDALIKLSEEQKGVYPHHLESLTHSGKHYTDFYTFHGSIAFATAPQVCEAILNTIGKWRDGQ